MTQKENKMYMVLYNSSRDPLEIAKWLNDQKDRGAKFVSCNQDFYIFLVE